MIKSIYSRYVFFVFVTFAFSYGAGCQNVSVSSGRSITVSAGATISAAGNLVNAGTINLNSSTSDYSQMKISGAASGAGTVVQSQHLETGHHMVSSPMTTGFNSTSGDKTKLFSYNAGTGAWNSIGTGNTTAGTGLFAYVHAATIPFLTSAGTASVTGAPNTSMTWSLSNATTTATGGSGSGWNLLGNPYTCGLDFSGLYSNNSSLVNNAFYIWNPATSAYVYYSGGGISSTVIPPMQAFWVQAKSGQTGNISSTMATNGTVATPQTFYKNLPDNLVVTVTKTDQVDITDKLWVANITGAIDGYDGQWDAWKMTNGPTMPNVYTYYNAEGIAINATDISSNTVLPMGFDYATAGTKFKASLEQVTNGQLYDVYLEDKLDQSFNYLNSGDYLFEHKGWTDESPRFALHFSLNSVGLDDNESYSSLIVYQNRDRIVLNCSDCGFTDYRLHSLDGREYSRGKMRDGMQSISAPVTAGLYIIELRGSHGASREKISINY